MSYFCGAWLSWRAPLGHWALEQIARMVDPAMVDCPNFSVSGSSLPLKKKRLDKIKEHQSKIKPCKQKLKTWWIYGIYSSIMYYFNGHYSLLIAPHRFDVYTILLSFQWSSFMCIMIHLLSVSIASHFVFTPIHQRFTLQPGLKTFSHLSHH